MEFRSRLEEIKNTDISLLYGTKLKERWDWLIQQAERVQELEKRCHYLNNELFSERTIKNEFQQGIEKQGKRIKDLEQVLEFYADEQNYLEMVDQSGVETLIEEDNGEMARQIITTRKEA
ncbi:hypothetical protein [Virgibacillus chiguensis]|uniref:Uncharacterized protein n=1 Tax=Virgibacillus chiguensis TaxID=411959 RepID=A0A1M5VIK6_9BACI|nr:hypothetical protein [Virgibacillus chiguensis]SHH75030.1 hypothetical protein SAMN05421807_112138 [Virgibacillus chiguensis]